MARHLITSALPYINGIKHLGNLVGSQLPADLYARFLRARGHEVMFICATDEHGTPAELAAAKAGKPVEVEELRTLADSLGGGVGQANRYTFSMVRDLVDDVILVTEAEIAAGIRHAYLEEREVVEGAGAVGIAALMAGRIRASGPVLALVSGRNIDMDLHRRVVAGASGLEDAA